LRQQAIAGQANTDSSEKGDQYSYERLPTVPAMPVRWIVGDRELRADRGEWGWPAVW
jgi:hypothetical protein